MIRCHLSKENLTRFCVGLAHISRPYAHIYAIVFHLISCDSFYRWLSNWRWRGQLGFWNRSRILCRCNGRQMEEKLSHVFLYHKRGALLWLNQHLLHNSVFENYCEKSDAALLKHNRHWGWLSNCVYLIIHESHIMWNNGGWSDDTQLFFLQSIKCLTCQFPVVSYHKWFKPISRRVKINSPSWDIGMKVVAYVCISLCHFVITIAW